MKPAVTAWVVMLGLLCITQAAAGETTRMVIRVDPYQGTLAVEQGRLIAPLYEATFQIQTKALGGWKPAPIRSDVGIPVALKELSGLEEDRCLEFWTDEYIGIYSYQDNFEFGFTLGSCPGRPPRPLSSANHVLVDLPPQALGYLAWSDATGRPQWAVRRASVQQVGQLKVLCVVRGVFMLYPDPTGPFLVDVWVAVFPIGADLIFQAARYPMWP